MEVPDEVKRSGQALSAMIQAIEGMIEPLFQVEPRQINSLFERKSVELEEEKGPDVARQVRKQGKLVTARLNVTLAYIVYGLFFMYLKTNGISPTDHQVKQELSRVQTYFKKMKDLETEPVPEKGPGMRLNKEAAQRFISYAVKPRTSNNDENSNNNSSRSEAEKTPKRKRRDSAADETSSSHGVRKRGKNDL